MVRAQTLVSKQLKDSLVARQRQSVSASTFCGFSKTEKTL